MECIIKNPCLSRENFSGNVVFCRRAVLQRPAGQECVLTAHAAPQWMLDAADYVTKMECIRHPYQKGIAARKGVEY